MMRRRYMAGAEFKARQLWLDFHDAAGTALHAIADSVDASRQALKKWLKALRMPRAIELPSLLQLPLPVFAVWFSAA